MKKHPLLSIGLLLILLAFSCASPRPGAVPSAERAATKEITQTEASLTIEALHENSVTILYTGTVADVIAGRVSEGAERWISAADFKAGFEAGSPLGLSSLGEFIAFNGTAYAKSTDEASPDYFKLISGPRFVSTCGAFIPKDASPTAKASYRAADGESMDFTMLYEALYARLKRPYCFIGTARFDQLAAVAVAKAPISGKNIFENKSEYYPHKPLNAQDVPAAVMGCAADFKAELAEEQKVQLERILYNNPFDKGGALSVHTHLLILDRPLEDLDQVRPEQATDVMHLLSQSKVKALELELYPIDRLQALDASD